LFRLSCYPSVHRRLSWMISVLAAHGLQAIPFIILESQAQHGCPAVKAGIGAQIEIPDG
jgi:hypothetical protein